MIDKDLGERLLRASEDPEIQALAEDPEALKRAWFEQLAQHPDPVWSEIGTQLRDGTMDMAQLHQTSFYREFVFEQAHQNFESHLEWLHDAAEDLEDSE